MNTSALLSILFFLTDWCTNSRALDLDSICLSILNFLTDRSHKVRVGSHISSSLSLNTGSPHGCVLSPLLYTLYTHDCTPIYSSNTIIKLADDTTVVELISGGNESSYWKEMEQLSEWCRHKNLCLNITKTKKLIVDYRRTLFIWDIALGQEVQNNYDKNK